MLEFADAKRIIKTIKTKHAGDVEFLDLMVELFDMLEESTADKFISLQQEVDDWKERAADIEQARQSLQTELDELNKAYHDSVNALQVATHNTMDLAETAVKPKGKKPGRPKKDPVKELARELADMEGKNEF